MARRPSFGVLLLIGILGGGVVFAGWGAWAAWRLAGDVRMGVHGWIATGLAGVGVALMTGGFMWLAFYSARKGYDDDQRD